MKQRILIIAEAGVNHNGSLETAGKLVDSAAAAGADAVKFQTFRTEQMVCRGAPKAAYQERTTGAGEGQYEMLRRLELDAAAHEKLFARCRKRGILFISSPFDHGSIDLLNGLGVEIFKIPSGELTNLPYLRHIGRLGKKVILSTGMADLAEVGEAVEALEKAGTDRGRLTLLHCNTAYPTPFADVNLLAMLALRDAFPGAAIGYSDHTPGIEIPIAAAALGALVIEKHFTLYRTMPGPDHLASLEPGELASMVRAVRHVEEALGDGAKKASPSELANRASARKSIVAVHRIHRGEYFTEENLATKRPGTGISPMRWDEVIGKRAEREYEEDECL